MQYKTLFSLFVAALAVCCLPGCGGDSSQTGNLEITCGEFKEQPAVYRELETTGGSTFTVTLCTSVTAGFLWDEDAVIADEMVVKQVDHAVEGKGMLDASSEEVWTFQALSTGNTTVSLQYSRPWEMEEEQKLWTLELLVFVR